MAQRARRRSSAEWAALVAEWNQSGESADGFARRHRINARTLIWWRSEGRKRERQAARAVPSEPARPSRAARIPAFAEVRVRERGASSSPACVEIAMEAGILVRVREGADAALLAEVIRALRAC